MIEAYFTLKFISRCIAVGFLVIAVIVYLVAAIIKIIRWHKK